MTKPLRTQFVVVDGARARWIRRSDETRDLVTDNEIKAAPKAPTGGPQGVVFERAGGGRHAVEQGRGVHEQDPFVLRVAEALNQQAERGAFERLAIVAPARTLNALREELAPAARDRLARSLAKDLTKVPDHDLDRWLRPLEL
jgi:protein required for attachment to host cells